MRFKTINDDNLTKFEITLEEEKVRAVLIKDNNILVANYGGNILLPGGKVDKGENVYSAIIRELKEEIGIDYYIDELEPLLNLEYYQRNYPTREGIIKNRKIITNFFLGEYKGINLDNTRLTKKEKNGKFELKLVNIDDLNMFLNQENTNPRNKFFVRELQEVLKNIEELENKTKKL